MHFVHFENCLRRINGNDPQAENPSAENIHTIPNVNCYLHLLCKSGETSRVRYPLFEEEKKEKKKNELVSCLQNLD